MSRPIQHQCQEFPNPRNSHLIQQPGRSKICYFAQMDFDLRKICYDHEDIESLSKGTDAKILLKSQTKQLNSLVSHNPEAQLCGTGSFHAEEMLAHKSHSFSNVFLF